MYNIATLNAISPKGLKQLDENFKMTETIDEADGILVRSADMHNMEFSKNLKAIARAGAGTNNIPLDKCTDEGIVVFNTPGANANAVKELVIAALLLSSRKIVEAADWSQALKGKEDIAKLTESGKKQFAGPEIKGKKLGVLGLGAIGVLVANAAVALGMDVIGYDPYLSVKSAWSISSEVKLAATVEEIAQQCDYITVHVPLLDSTRNIIDARIISLMKDGTRLLNFARPGLVDNAAVKEALKTGKLAKYMADFPDEEILGVENIVVTPHLGASTPESEENCAEMAAKELKEFLMYGNIKNSVNFPVCVAPYTPGKARIAIAHKNVPNVVGSLTAIFSKENLNIDGMINKSRGAIAYSIFDFDSIYDKKDKIIKDVMELENIIKIRIVREN